MRTLISLLLLLTCVSCHDGAQMDKARRERLDVISAQYERERLVARQRAQMDHDTGTVGILQTERALRR